MASTSDMNEGGLAWEAAKTRYLTNLSDDEKQLFESATPQSIFDDASRADEEHSRRSKFRIMVGKIQLFITAVDDYGKAMDVFANIQPGILAPIWGSVRVVLIAATKYIRFYKQVVNTFQDIGAILPRFENYQKMFPSIKHDRLTTLITETYIDIIEFCSDLRQLLEEKSKKSSAKRLLVPFAPNNHFNNATSRFKKHVEAVREEAAHCAMLEQAEAREIVRRDRALDRIRCQNVERLRTLSKLSNIDYAAHQRRLSKKRHSGTGDWLQICHEYQRWEEGPGLFCCYGIPGAGKSMLVSNVVESIANSKKPLAYYFCDYSDKRTLSCAAIFGTLAQQLLLQQQSVPDEVASQIAITCSSSNPDYLILLDILVLALGLLKNDVTTIIIDGLDELSDEEQQSLAKALGRLSDTRVRLLLSARQDFLSRINIAFPAVYRIHVSSSSIRNDISSYVRHSVQDLIDKKQFSIRNPFLKDMIIDKLIEGAEGMFLWVYFQLHDLCQAYTDAAIIRILENLPKSLKETYDRLLNRITGEGQSLLRRAFQWIVFARRPLTIAELSDAVAFGIDDEFWDPSKIPSNLRILVERCNRLIVVDEDTGVVTLAHYTIQQYLTDEIASPSLYHFHAAEAGTLLGEVCIAYLSFSDFETQVVPRSQKDPYQSLAILTRAEPTQYVRDGFKLPTSVNWLGHNCRNQSKHIDFRNYLPPRQPTIDLTQKYKLLEYVAENWLWHSASLNAEDHPKRKRLLRTLLLEKSLLIKFRPWSDDKELIAWALENSYMPVVHFASTVLEGTSVSIENIGIQVLAAIRWVFDVPVDRPQNPLQDDMIDFTSCLHKVYRPLVGESRAESLGRRIYLSLIQHTRTGASLLRSIRKALLIQEQQSPKPIYTMDLVLSHLVIEASVSGNLLAFMTSWFSPDLPIYVSTGLNVLRQTQIYCYEVDGRILNALDHSAIAGDEETMLLLFEEGVTWTRFKLSHAPDISHHPYVKELIMKALLERKMSRLYCFLLLMSGCCVRGADRRELLATIAHHAFELPQIEGTGLILQLWSDNFQPHIATFLLAGGDFMPLPDKTGLRMGRQLYFSIFSTKAYAGNSTPDSMLSDLEVCNLLLTAGASPNELNYYQMSPLAAATMIGDIALINLLLKLGADIDSSSRPLYRPDLESFIDEDPKHGTWTAMVAKRDRWTVSNLAITSSGWSAIQYAAALGHTDIVARLLDFGATTRFAKTQQDHPIYLAIKCNFWNIVELFLQRDPTTIAALPNLMFDAYEKRDIGMVDLLLDYADKEASMHQFKSLSSIGFDINTLNRENKTLLDIACERGHTKLGVRLSRLGGRATTKQASQFLEQYEKNRRQFHRRRSTDSFQRKYRNHYRSNRAITSRMSTGTVIRSINM